MNLRHSFYHVYLHKNALLQTIYSAFQTKQSTQMNMYFYERPLSSVEIRIGLVATWRSLHSTDLFGAHFNESMLFLTKFHPYLQLGHNHLYKFRALKSNNRKYLTITENIHTTLLMKFSWRFRVYHFNNKSAIYVDKHRHYTIASSFFR